MSIVLTARRAARSAAFVCFVQVSWIGAWLLALSAIASTASASVEYTVKDLGSFTPLGAHALNQAGQAVAFSGSVPGGHAFLYDGAHALDLGINGVPLSLNGQGQIVGWYAVAPTPDNTGLTHAFVLQNGQLTDLGTLGGYSQAFSVNDAGQAVGISNLDPTQQGATYYPVLFANGAVTQISTLAGTAVAINKAGQVVGDYIPNGQQDHAFLYQGGMFHDLGTLGGPTSNAAGINDLGQIVGASRTKSGAIDAFIYQAGKMTDLGHFTVGTKAYSTYATGINDGDTIIGTAVDNTGTIPFVYQNGHYSTLANLVSPNLEIRWDAISGINDAGQLLAIGEGAVGGQVDTFLLTPVPEPSALATCLLLTAGLLRRRSRVRA